VARPGTGVRSRSPSGRDPPPVGERSPTLVDPSGWRATRRPRTARRRVVVGAAGRPVVAAPLGRRFGPVTVPRGERGVAAGRRSRSASCPSSCSAPTIRRTQRRHDRRTVRGGLGGQRPRGVGASAGRVGGDPGGTMTPAGREETGPRSARSGQRSRAVAEHVELGAEGCGFRACARPDPVRAPAAQAALLVDTGGHAASATERLLPVHRPSLSKAPRDRADR
jgi:hypothetical protein